jgi:Flp pilus assembly protein TadG
MSNLEIVALVMPVLMVVIVLSVAFGATWLDERALRRRPH